MYSSSRILPGNHVYAYYYIVLEYSSTVLKYGCTRMNCHVSFATLLTELAVRPRLILKGPRRRPWPAHMAPVPAPVQQPEVARGSLRGVNTSEHLLPAFPAKHWTTGTRTNAQVFAVNNNKRERERETERYREGISTKISTQNKREKERECVSTRILNHSVCIFMY